MLLDIDAMGGAVKAIEQDYIQQQIAASAYTYQQEIENGEHVIVGVNKFDQKGEKIEASFKVDDKIRLDQIEKIRILKTSRDNTLVASSLSKLRVAATGNENLMPYILNCVEAYATLGEIAGILRDIFGEY